MQENGTYLEIWFKVYKLQDLWSSNWLTIIFYIAPRTQLTS